MCAISAISLLVCIVFLVPPSFSAPSLNVISPRNHTIASKIVAFEAIIDISPQYRAEVISDLGMCLSFDTTNTCFPVDGLVMKRSLLMAPGLIHHLEVILCHRSNEQSVSEGADIQCSHVISRELFVIYPRDTGLADMFFEHTRNGQDVTRLLLPGLVTSYSTNPRVSELAVIAASGLSSELYAVLPLVRRPQEARDVCALVSAVHTSCCLRPSPLCLPAVAHVSLLVVDRSTDWRNESFLLELCTQWSVVHGHLLIVSADMSVDEVLSSLPRHLTHQLPLTDLLRANSYREQTPDIPWTAVLLTDLRSVYLRGGDCPAMATRTAHTHTHTDGQSWLQLRPLHSLPPSSATFSFNDGMNTAQLTHVCLYRNTSTVVLLNDNPTRPVLDEPLRRKLGSFSSGFHSTDPLGAWKFTEMTREALSRDVGGAAGQGQALWFQGATGLAAAPYFPHVVHATETMLPLLHTVSHPEHYPPAHRLRRLMFPTVFTDDVWARAIASLVRWQVSGVYRSRGDDNPLALFLRSDLLTLLEQLEEQRFVDLLGWEGSTLPLVCLEEAIMTGCTETFVSSAEEARAFRSFADDVIDDPSWREGDGLEGDVTEGGGGEGGGLPVSTERVDGRKIRITIVARSGSRWMLNLAAMLDVLEREFAEGGLSRLPVDVHWMRNHVVFMEVLSFQQQALLMRRSDILIAVHGAALTNGIFMQPGSVVLEVLTSPWYEPFIDVALERFGVRYEVLPQTSLQSSERCAFLERCMSELTVLHRQDFSCFGLRQCSVNVDVEALQIMLLKAVRYVSTIKMDVHTRRMRNTEPPGEID